jgi:hypothetical protein
MDECCHELDPALYCRRSCRDSLRLHNARRQRQRSMKQAGRSQPAGKAKRAGVRKKHKPYVRRNQVAIELPAETPLSGGRADKVSAAS